MRESFVAFDILSWPTDDMKTKPLVVLVVILAHLDSVLFVAAPDVHRLVALLVGTVAHHVWSQRDATCPRPLLAACIAGDDNSFLLDSLLVTHLQYF
jgi:hypothetical protein